MDGKKNSEGYFLKMSKLSLIGSVKRNVRVPFRELV